MMLERDAIRKFFAQQSNIQVNIALIAKNKFYYKTIITLGDLDSS
jgi:hypothetical protein